MAFEPEHLRSIYNLDVSPIGLGTVKFGRNTDVKYPRPFDLPSMKELQNLLASACSLGVNLIDTAPAYGESEERLGQLLSGQRHQWYVSTKVGESYDGRSRFDFSAEHTRTSVEDSLKRLRTDYLDIVLVHCDDEDLKALQSTDVIAELRSMQNKGFIRYVGASTKTLPGGYFAIENTDLIMVSGDSDQIPLLEKAKLESKPALVKKALQSGHAMDIRGNLAAVLAYPSVASVIIGSINQQHVKENVAHATSL